MDTSDVSMLCDRCTMFTEPPRYTGVPYLSSVGRLKSSPCIVCQIQYRAIEALGLLNDDKASTDQGVDQSQDLHAGRDGNPDRVISILVRISGQSSRESSMVRVMLHTLPGTDCPWGIFLPHRSLGPVFGLGWQRKLLSWVQRCATEHKSCGNMDGQTLPTRVLDISPNMTHVKLIVRSSPEDRGRYVALSHCWGGHQPIRTTLANINDHTDQGIPLDKMPKTYRDAIELCRVLGIRHLWIDSLCIIQDSHDDWVRESSSMADVYSRAFLCVAATSSGNCDAGFSNYAPVVISGITRSGRSYQVLAYEQPTHLTSTNEQDTKEAFRFWPLRTRAWAYQERILAKRLVQMCTDEMVWDCREGHICECGERSPDADFYSKQNTYEIENVLRTGSADHIDAAWRVAVNNFTKLSLTKSTDRLPALSGIAKVVGERKGPGVNYLAGLWSDTLDVDILWYTANIRAGGDLFQGKGGTPSWSWADCGTFVEFPRIATSFEAAKVVRSRGILEKFFEIGTVDCKPATEDPTGQVDAGGRLDITVDLFDTILHEMSYTDCQPETAHTRAKRGGRHHAFVQLNLDTRDHLKRMRAAKMPVKCARMAIVDEVTGVSGHFASMEYVLILEPIDLGTHVYRRMGMLLIQRTVGTGDNIEWTPSPFESLAERRTISLV